MSSSSNRPTITVTRDTEDGTPIHRDVPVATEEDVQRIDDELDRIRLAIAMVATPYSTHDDYRRDEIVERLKNGPLT